MSIIGYVVSAELCKGSTTDSDSVCLGSNPSRAANDGGSNAAIPFRGVAQFGRALRSGRRGRRFKSCHLDHLNETRFSNIFIEKRVSSFYKIFSYREFLFLFFQQVFLKIPKCKNIVFTH